MEEEYTEEYNRRDAKKGREAYIEAIKAGLKEEELLREKRERKEQLKREDFKRRMSIIVYNTDDLLEKYKLYSIDISRLQERAILRKPIEVKYWSQFVSDCHRLGLEACCDSEGNLSYYL